ncbi:hypothetical protein [Glaciecola sp. 1036]|uniref:hypothetical protein n=1 Tax=Alteromonadaceae TaxID=72275 RepID=UPI003CFBFF5F
MHPFSDNSGVTFFNTVNMDITTSFIDTDAFMAILDGTRLADDDQMQHIETLIDKGILTKAKDDL